MPNVGDIIFFEGRKYVLRDNGYYCAHMWTKGESRSSLHRAIWESKNGKIPFAHHIHHIDHNPLNNSIENLQLISAGDHAKLHWKNWVGSDANKKQLREASEKAKEWHRSDHGREWHRIAGKKSWEDKLLHDAKCQEPDCGAEFKTPFPTRAKYCSGACKERSRRRAQGLPMGKRRQTSWKKQH